MSALPANSLPEPGPPAERVVSLFIPLPQRLVPPLVEQAHREGRTPADVAVTAVAGYLTLAALAEEQGW